MPTLQSKLKAMKTIIPESLKFPRRKLNETNHIKCMSSVSASMRHKSTIKDEFKMNWHKLPESSIRELNKADYTEHISSMITLMKHKLAIQDVISFQKGIHF